MSDHFDPYHRWLGIPPKHQPADYYRLLGVDRFESDPEVIADAAERARPAAGQRIATGRHRTGTRASSGAIRHVPWK